MKTYFQGNIQSYTSPVGRKNESVKVLDINVNICRLLKKNNKGNPFAAYYVRLFKHYGKVPTSCPLKIVRLSMLLLSQMKLLNVSYFRDIITC